MADSLMPRGIALIFLFLVIAARASAGEIREHNGEKDYMRKERQETVTSAKRFGVDVVETVWPAADHGGIFKNAMAYQKMLDWLVKDEHLGRERASEARSQEG